ncbi:MAG: 3-deoxy-7-phosphoheptulonate synthase [Marinoscillum sp.]|uniref:3-deoxy-7-phosphoheptulonate synthase n=1 Tax=Marinoscillum sp. TaxID=2024838 RepID=UPI0032F3FCDA
MIIHLKGDLASEKIATLAIAHEAIHFRSENRDILVLSSKVTSTPAALAPYADQSFVLDSDIQLASRDYQPTKRTIQIGQDAIGGNTRNTMMMAGPCSIESWEQISQAAELLKSLNIKTLRAGCFKPRTSPYTFQGLGEEGLKMLVKVRETYGLNIITEVKDSSHADLVIDHADIVQIGTKAMYDQSILRKCGKSTKPVLLKRGFGTTLQEFVQAAEFILSGGNPNVMLCERGIRTFENKTRFTLDLTGVAYLKEFTNLPVVVDPSHAMGYRYGVPDLTRAAVAMGIDGLLIETHPTPELAKSDAAQQLNFTEFTKMFHSLKPVAEAVGQTMT